MVLKGIDNIEVYLCQEGMARFCTMDYAKPSEKNLDNVFMHLTNSAINKANVQYKMGSTQLN
jgi:tubulin polyglutamylase TTLL11